MNFAYLLEQTPIRDSFLPHLSRGDLQNIGQTNRANRAAVYNPTSSTAVQPLELPFSGTRGMENGIQVEYRRPVINNPNYVNEVRQIITGNHPQYYPWQVAVETGINNPSRLRIVEASTYQAYETARAAGNRSWPTGFQNFEDDYKWFGPQGELMRRGWANRML